MLSNVSKTAESVTRRPSFLHSRATSMATNMFETRRLSSPSGSVLRRGLLARSRTSQKTNGMRSCRRHAHFWRKRSRARAQHHPLYLRSSTMRTNLMIPLRASSSEDPELVWHYSSPCLFTNVRVLGLSCHVFAVLATVSKSCRHRTLSACTRNVFKSHSRYHSTFPLSSHQVLTLATVLKSCRHRTLSARTCNVSFVIASSSPHCMFSYSSHHSRIPSSLCNYHHSLHHSQITLLSYATTFPAS